MTQVYSDPSRASDPHALPDVEVFELTAHEVAASAIRVTASKQHKRDEAAWCKLAIGNIRAGRYETARDQIEAAHRLQCEASYV